ncbi:MAG TPA: hypothetical protein VIM65_17720 [Cyclobacteriaceae bacterium]
MKELEKQFCPKDQSEKILNLGFKEECLAYYNKIWFGDFDIWQLNNSILYESRDVIGSVLFSQAFDFFREEFNIDAWVQPYTCERITGTVYIPDETYSFWVFRNGEIVCDRVDFETFHEARQACLEKLIEIAKEKRDGQTSV